MPFDKEKKNRAAVVLGRLGGLAKSEKKAASSRKNGLLGGAHKWKTKNPNAPRPRQNKLKEKLVISGAPGGTSYQRIIKELPPR